ncbi:hypothetical protein LX36DRAFT_703687 [Colletotrichum falcatum]|nr:hypothetical protein LX36DRAFT_703687 [Colletotrichum falcatum]
MKSSIIVTLVGALAATVNGVPIIDNANKAVIQSAQADVVGANVVHGIVHGHASNIQSARINMPVSHMGMNSSVSGALAASETKANGTLAGLSTIHMAETVSVAFNTSITGIKANMSNMPTKTSGSPAAPPMTTMDALDYVDELEYWFHHCLLAPVGQRPLDCLTMSPPQPPVDDFTPILELTTLTTDSPMTLTGQETIPTEYQLQLTTIHSLMTPTPTPTSTPADEVVIVVTVTSTVNVFQTEDPKIEHSFAKVNPASTMAIRG